MNTALFLIQIILQLVVLRLALRLGQIALAAFVVIEALLANLFVLKQITLFGLSVTASDSFIIGSMLALALYQELFGQKESKTLSLITFGSLFFMTLTSLLHLALQAAPSDTSQTHYHYILNQAPRISISSLIAFYLSSRSDIAFFAFLKKFYTNLSFRRRAFISTLIAQGIDTTLFSFLALYGIMDHLLSIIIFSFGIKVLCLSLYLTCQPLIVKIKQA